MVDESGKTSERAPKPGRDDKADRLAAQLRRNLARRKAQGRARRAAEVESAGETDDGGRS